MKQLVFIRHAGFLAFVLSGLFLWLPLKGQYESGRMERPKNVILMIGDGMGISQLSSTYYFPDEKGKEEEPAFSRFKYIGLARTSSGQEVVTQSPAAATALATGYKTYNMAVGVDLDTVVRENIVEILSLRGYMTGVIATSHITDATPAGFYAHQPDRYMQAEIAKDLLNSEIDFFAGGGSKYFRDSTGAFPFEEYGIEINYRKLKKIKKPEEGRRYGFLLGQEHMPTMLHGRGDFLARATSIAMDFLATGTEGYFLMVEGSQIDWAGHGNQVEYMKAEVNDFESTVGIVMDYAQENGETLVIVTADHETGGFTLGAAGNNSQGTSDYSVIEPTFASTNHSAALVPVFAYGPGAENFIGVYENTEIYHKLVELMESE
ncbi:MAG: alkaline phosphatase [Bacteroidales bacterium]|nr:alkaline phosphatase [Bacteroidales bacterium]